MVCTDRQLTLAQLQEGFDQQRAGVARAIRPFSGQPTVENLVDYINRELFPAVKQTRSGLNEVFLQVKDNAPSGNPLGFFFSVNTAAGDPTQGRLRLNASPQENATIMRVSELSGRLVDVVPWLDVMAGSATVPLGVVTLNDAIDPGRFLRFDLSTMTDQGTYWDLAVSLVESSHPDPFVDGGPVVVSFIPGVASSGVVVAPGVAAPANVDYFVGTASAGLSAERVGTDTASIDVDLTTPGQVKWNVIGAPGGIVATTGAVTIPSGGGASLFAGIRDNGSAENDRTNLNHLSTTSVIAIVTDDSVNDELEITHQRAALTGAITASQNSNATLFDTLASGAGLTGGGTAVLAVGAGTNVTVNANDVAVDDYPLSGLADQAANTIVANANGISAAPTAVAVAADSVLARVGGNLVSHPWSTLFGTYLSYSAGVADWVGLDVRVNSGALTGTRHRLNVIGTSPVSVSAADDGGSDEVDVTIALSAIPLTALATQAADTFLGNFTAGNATPTARAGSSVAGNGLTYTSGGTLDVGAGTHITVGVSDVAVNLTTLVPAIDTASVIANGTTLERAALTGEVTASQNSNTTAIVRSTTFSWTGAHDFTGAVPFTVGVSSDVSVASTAGGLWLSAGHATPVVSPSVSNGDVLINAANGAGVFATATPVTNVNVGEVQVTADLAVNVTAGAGINLDAAGTSTFDTTVGNITVQTTAAGSRVSVVGQDDVLVQATDDSVFINANVAVAVAATGASGLFRVSTNGTERLEIEPDGSWQLGGNTGTANNITTSQGSAAPPTWQIPVAFTTIFSSTVAAQLNNLNIGDVNVVRLTPTAPREITGMVPPRNGQVVIVLNAATTAGFNLKMTDESDTTTGTASTAANRFALSNSTSITILQEGMAIFWYDTTSSRWRAIQ